jgi:hypothetical protein
MNDNEIYMFVDVDDDPELPEWKYGLWLQVDWGVMRLGPVWYETEDDAVRDGERILAALQGQTKVDR